MPSLNEVTNGPGTGDPAQRFQPDYEANAEPVIEVPEDESVLANATDENPEPEDPETEDE